jgi:regulatory protein
VIRIKPIEPPTIPAGGGTITNVAFQKQDPNRCSVFLNDAYAFGLHVDIVMRTGLKKGMNLSEEQCKELTDEDVYFKAMKRCMDYIAYRLRTAAEIDTRLRQLGVPDAIAERIRQKLNDLDLINDAEFARMFAESRVRSKGFGFIRIKQDLMQKGIPADMAEEALRLTYPEEDQMVQLEKQVELAGRKYRKETDERQRKQKMTQFLMRRGFNSDQIRKALKSAK